MKYISMPAIVLYIPVLTIEPRAEAAKNRRKMENYAGSKDFHKKQKKSIKAEKKILMRTKIGKRHNRKSEK